jgi:hypothetical protein
MARRADERKVAEWRGRFERFRRGGLSVARFCAVERVSVPSFYQWRKKLQHSPTMLHADREAVSAATWSTATTFAPLRLVGSASVTAWLPGGTRLEIPLGDARVLQGALEVLLRADLERAGGESC